MQTEPRALLRQQFILKRLGFNPGPLDGVWGPKSIDAKRCFESRINAFRPARQTGGLPFSANDRLPAGFWLEDGLIQAPCIVDHLDEEAKAVERLESALAEKEARRLSVASPASEPVSDPVPAEAEDSPVQLDVKSHKQQRDSKHHQRQSNG